jgi:hypothetical protein
MIVKKGSIARLMYSNSVDSNNLSRESLFLGVTSRRDLSEGMLWRRRTPI